MPYFGTPQAVADLIDRFRVRRDGDGDVKAIMP